MFILTQDKKHIINMANVTEIYIEESAEYKSHVISTDIVKTGELFPKCCRLGAYKDSNLAQDIFNQIFDAAYKFTMPQDKTEQ